MKLKWILGAMLLVLIICQSTSALSYSPPCAIFDNKSTDWTVTKTIPKFDPSLGVLDQVTVNASACSSQWFRIDNEASLDQDCSLTTTADISTSLPAGKGLDFSFDLFTDLEFNLPADEGVEDVPYTGRDFFGKYNKVCGEKKAEFTDIDDLTYWKGSGNVSFTANADISSDFSGNDNFDQSTRSFASEKICVVYEYHLLSMSISGRVINDGNQAGLKGWKVELKDSEGNVINSTTTAANGTYSFIGLAPGSYTVVETVEPGWNPVGGPSIAVSLNNSDVSGMDFHNRVNCSIATVPFSVCYGVNVTRDMILNHTDITSCVDDPLVDINHSALTYTIRCTDANGCNCTGKGFWRVRPECGLETEPFSVCYGVNVTPEMILKHVDTSICTDTPKVEIGPGKTYTVTCTAANGSSCYGEGTWSEYPKCSSRPNRSSSPMAQL